MLEHSEGQEYRYTSNDLFSGIRGNTEHCKNTLIKNTVIKNTSMENMLIASLYAAKI